LSIAETFSSVPKEKSKGKILFHQFRSDELKDLVESNGWEMANSMSGNVSYLVIPDGDDVNMESAKITSAKDLGVPVVTSSYIKENINKLK
jgi:NAD-dependent DNA ligase